MHSFGFFPFSQQTSNCLFCFFPATPRQPVACPDDILHSCADRSTLAEWYIPYLMLQGVKTLPLPCSKSNPGGWTKKGGQQRKAGRALTDEECGLLRNTAPRMYIEQANSQTKLPPISHLAPSPRRPKSRTATSTKTFIHIHSFIPFIPFITLYTLSSRPEDEGDLSVPHASRPPCSVCRVTLHSRSSFVVRRPASRLSPHRIPASALQPPPFDTASYRSDGIPYQVTRQHHPARLS